MKRLLGCRFRLVATTQQYCHHLLSSAPAGMCSGLLRCGIRSKGKQRKKLPTWHKRIRNSTGKALGRYAFSRSGGEDSFSSILLLGWLLNNGTSHSVYSEKRTTVSAFSAVVNCRRSFRPPTTGLLRCASVIQKGGNLKGRRLASSLWCGGQ